jgi:PPOX class probable F420-dependent enzyme
VDGKPKAGGQLARVRNVRAHPQVSLLLDDYTERWERLWWIRVDARASVVRPADEADPEVAAVLSALREKYPQYDHVSVLGDPPTLLGFDALRLSSWCASREAVPKL